MVISNIPQHQLQNISAVFLQKYDRQEQQLFLCWLITVQVVEKASENWYDECNWENKQKTAAVHNKNKLC